MENELKEQSKNSDKPWLFKKGQSGNPKGRPLGKSLKERAKAMLNAMTEEEEQEFLNGLPKEIIWKMAEGNPENKTELTGDNLQPILVEFVNAKDNTDTKGISRTL